MLTTLVVPGFPAASETEAGGLKAQGLLGLQSKFLQGQLGKCIKGLGGWRERMKKIRMGELERRRERMNISWMKWSMPITQCWEVETRGSGVQGPLGCRSSSLKTLKEQQTAEREATASEGKKLAALESETHTNARWVQKPVYLQHLESHKGTLESIAVSH